MAEDHEAGSTRALYVLALRQTGKGTPAAPWEGFSLREEMRLFERRFIRLALEESGGRVTPAARLLGLNYQSLIALLNDRHRELLPLRSPVVPRRRNLIGPRMSRRQPPEPLVILLAERDESVAADVHRTLEAEGWAVDACRDGAAALEKLGGDDRYDLLLFGGELPGVSGFELAQRARELPRRGRTPVVVMAAGEREREAWAAGADAFLRWPEESEAVAQTVRRLVRRGGRR